MNCNFGNALRTYRDASRMTQETLAEKLDVTPETISKWETGDTDPSEKNLETLVDMFGDQLGVEYLKSKSKIAMRCLSGISYKPKTPREVAYLQSMMVNKCATAAKMLSEIMLNEEIDDDEVEPTYNCLTLMEEGLSQQLENVAYLKDMLSGKINGGNRQKIIQGYGEKLHYAKKRI